MNPFQLVLKNMRQRALSTWLTLLSVLLGVALAIAIIILRREAGSLFGQKDYGYEVIIGKKGSGTQLVMNTVYHLDVSPGNIPYSMYQDMLNPAKFGRLARIAVPYVVGDTYKGKYRIVGTSTKLFGYSEDDGKPLEPDHVLEYRPGKTYELESGKVFAPNKFEAVIGSDLATLTDLKIGTQFQATHGMPRPDETPDIHPEIWTVVGILKQTHTANDRVVFIPYRSLYTIGEHAAGLKAQWYIANHLPPPPPDIDPDKIPVYTLNPDKTFNLLVPQEMWEISAILVKTRGPWAADSLMYNINNGNEAMAVNPASVMRQFFDTFLAGPTLVLLVVALLVTVVAGVGILVSIYNSVSARLREIAILRALGATRSRVLLLICLESSLIGLIGGLLGILVGHVMAGIGSFYFDRYVGQGINWISTDRYEWIYLAAVVVLALIAGLVPAFKAYRTPVATNLVSG
jgi:putative ABC transport system permease protein